MQPEERRDDTALRKALADTVIIRPGDIAPCDHQASFPRPPCPYFGMHAFDGETPMCITHLNWSYARQIHGW